MGLFGGLVKGAIDTVMLPVDIVKDVVHEDRDDKGRSRARRRVDDLDADLEEVLDGTMP